MVGAKITDTPGKGAADWVTPSGSHHYVVSAFFFSHSEDGFCRAVRLHKHSAFDLD